MIVVDKLAQLLNWFLADNGGALRDLFEFLTLYSRGEK